MQIMGCSTQRQDSLLASKTTEARHMDPAGFRKPRSAARLPRHCRTKVLACSLQASRV
jgi:hypothetical protein